MDECIPLEVLGTLGTLGAEDPRRLHIERCARCSAMWVAYREFVRADAPGRAHVRDADKRLAAFIAERVEGIETGIGAPRRPRGRWFQIPTFRFVATTAAMVLVAVAVTPFLPDSREAVVLRGDPGAGFALQAPRTLDDGAIELGWAPVANADVYQVTILGTDLSEVFRMPATSETRITLDTRTLPAEATRWQVTALREGGVVAESTPAVLRP
jgi:hypothetical protein